MGKSWLVATVLVAAVTLLCTAGSAVARPAYPLLARSSVTVVRGGDVYARGWNLYVPPHTVTRTGWASVVSLGHGRVDLQISSSWRGSVEVTGPLRNSKEVIAHDLGGVWVPEGSQIGQRTVWVRSLSPFSISGLLSKVQDGLCLSILDGDLPGFAECLLDKGVSYVNGKIVSWLFSKISPSCSSALVADGLSAGSAKRVAVSVLKGILKSSSCSHGASSTGGASGGAKGPPLPVSGNPASGGGVQGPTANPQPTGIPEPPTVNAPEGGPPSSGGGGTTTQGFFIEDSIYGGTWARTDPDNGAWYPHGSPPPNGAYWYPNGLGVAVSCSESAAGYATVVNGVHGIWYWWAHVTDGKWVPTVVFSTVWNDGQLPGLPVC